MHIRTVRNNRANKVLIHLISLFLLSKELCTGNQYLIELDLITVLVGNRRQLYLPLVVNKVGRNIHFKVQCYLSGTLRNISTFGHNIYISQRYAHHILTVFIFFIFRIFITKLFLCLLAIYLCRIYHRLAPFCFFALYLAQPHTLIIMLQHRNDGSAA